MCPNKNVTAYFFQNDATITNDVESWSACSELCRQSDDCYFWTWYTAAAGQRANKCATMTIHDDSKSDINAVSGNRNCEGNKPVH